MAIPPRLRIPPRGDLRHFPPTNGPILLLAPDRRSIGIYQVPQNTVVFLPPPSAQIPPQPPPPAPPTPPPALGVGNDSQTCVNTCPEGASGEPISVTIPAGSVFAPTLEEANAQAMEDACAEAAALREASPCTYENEEQECCNTCPEGYTGDPICVTVPAGTYTSTVSQAAANALAMAAACAEADELRAETPCVPDTPCTYVFFDEHMPPANYDILNYWVPSTCVFNYTADTLLGIPFGKIFLGDYTVVVVPPAGGISGFENVYLFKKKDWIYTPSACGTVNTITWEGLDTSLDAKSSAFPLSTFCVIFQSGFVYVANSFNATLQPFEPTVTPPGTWFASFAPYPFTTGQIWNKYGSTGLLVATDSPPDPTLPMEFGFAFKAQAVSFLGYPRQLGLRSFKITITPVP